MGSLGAHVAHGFLFVAIGLWHLVNQIKLHALHPKSYTSCPWFPTSKYRYLELFIIMCSCIASISVELFIGPARHQPLDTDGTIPSNHLHNFEHSNMAMAFFVYSLFSIIIDKIQPPAQYGLTQMLGATAFGQELLLFHLHSTDHVGIESQYHRLLQIIIFVSLLTTLLGLGYPKGFLNSFIRSLSIFFQGVWITVTGVMLYTAELLPKGCFLKLEDGHKFIKCHSEEALERAKSLVNIQFSWYLIGVTIFALSLYLLLFKLFQAKVEYQSLTKFENQQYEEYDVEAQNNKEQKFADPKMLIL